MSLAMVITEFVAHGLIDFSSSFCMPHRIIFFEKYFKCFSFQFSILFAIILKYSRVLQKII